MYDLTCMWYLKKKKQELKKKMNLQVQGTDGRLPEAGIGEVYETVEGG